MGHWTNSNIRHTVTNGLFALQICQRCTLDPKKKNPYWSIRCLFGCPTEFPSGRGDQQV